MGSLRGTSPRRSLARRARVGAFVVAAAIGAAACGNSEASEDRDRNVPIGFAGWGQPESGIAITRLAQSKFTMTKDVTAVSQSDGSSLVMTTQLIVGEGKSRGDVTISRLTDDKQFDMTFGSNGVSRIRFDAAPGTYEVRLTAQGSVVVASFDSSQSQGFLGGSSVSITKYIAGTGAVDTGFGDKGTMPVTGFWVNDELSIAEDPQGRIYIADGRVNAEGIWSVRRYSATGLDTTYGVDGAALLPAIGIPDSIEGDVVSWPGPDLWIAGDGSLRFIQVGELRRMVPTSEVSSTERKASILLTRIVNESGTIGDDFNGPRFVWLGSIDPEGPQLSGVHIAAIAEGPGNTHFLTIEGWGTSSVIHVTDDFNSATVGFTPLSGALPISATGFTVNQEPLEHVVLVGGTKFSSPMVASIVADSLAAATHLVVGDFRSEYSDMWITNFVPVGDFPSVGYDISSVEYVGDDLFVNVESGRGVGNFGGDQTLNIRNRSGYLRLNSAGVAMPPYSGDNEMAPSPLNAAPLLAFPVNIVNTVFPAADGGLFTIGHRSWRPDAESTSELDVIRYSADGEPVETTTIDLGDFGMSVFPRIRHGFDHDDAFFILGTVRGSHAVAKVLVSKGSLDTSWGDNGIVTLPRAGRTSPFDWAGFFEASVSAQADGSVDVTTVRWGNDLVREGEAMPVVIRSVRIAPDGTVTDLSIPLTQREFFSNGGKSSSVADAFSTAVDAQGRVLVSYLAMDIPVDEKGEPEPGKIRVVGVAERFTRDGSLDQTFGDAGRFQVPVYSVTYAEPPVAMPKIAVRDDGRVFLGLVAMEVIASEGSMTVGSHTLYSIVLDTNGLAVDFTPPTVEGGVASDLVAPVLAVTPPARGTEQPVAVTTPAGTPTESVVPADVVQVTASTKPVITVIGSPANRTIDVRWAVPESLQGGKATYTVTASPGGKKCTTSTTSCSFKKLDPWVAYTFSIKTVAAASATVPDSNPSPAVKPIRVVKRGTTSELTDLITPASAGKQTWKVAGPCKLSGDKRKFIASKDAGQCMLSLVTAKSGKTPKTARSITVIVKAVAS